ncbi:MAG: hypothetical protein K6B68_05270 [Eubacterium sp.]|nr:hypothetical protein [Eubacterium sp.]
MPVMDGFELIDLLKNNDALRTIPVIVMTSEKDHLTGLYTKDFFTEYIRQIEKYSPEKKKDLVVVNYSAIELPEHLMCGAFAP